MSDDIWRDRRDDDDFSEFGSLFDEAAPTESIPETPAAAHGDENLNFSDDGSGPLPHWTEPATGEIPRFDTGEQGSTDADHEGDHEDLDVWSSFSSESPV